MAQSGMPSDPDLSQFAPPDQTSPVAPAAGSMKGDAFGRALPPGDAQPLQHRDARAHALRTFRRFISLLVFRRTGDLPDVTTVGLRVPEERIHVYQPDDVQNYLGMNSIGILPGRAVHEPYGLGPPVSLDDTADLFGAGTVLVRRSDHVETVAVEVVVDKAPVRDGIVAGLKQALQVDDGSGALRLVCPTYYDMVASFRLDESESIDDADGTNNRRRAHLYVLLQVPEVMLVPYRRAVVLPEVSTERGPL